MYIVIAQAYLFKFFYENFNILMKTEFSFLTVFFVSISAQIHVLIGYTATLTFAHISALYSALYIAITAIIFVKLKQVDRLLRGVRSPRWFTILTFNRFARLHSKTVVTVTAVDKAMGMLMATIVAIYR